MRYKFVVLKSLYTFARFFKNSHLDSLAAVEALMECVKESLIEKENVYLRGFGTFELKHRAQKTARNISKNTTLVIKAHDIPHFKPCKEFMQAVAEK